MKNKKTLVLGTGKLYAQKNYHDFRCSPIPMEEWIHDEYTSVDDCKEVMPDILYDLSKRNWPFENESYNRIIDTTGGGFTRHVYSLENECIFMKEVKRILKPSGVFYGFNTSCNKRNNISFVKNK
jgi:hypothetical protein